MPCRPSPSRTERVAVETVLLSWTNFCPVPRITPSASSRHVELGKIRNSPHDPAGTPTYSRLIGEIRRGEVFAMFALLDISCRIQCVEVGILGGDFSGLTNNSASLNGIPANGNLPITTPTFSRGLPSIPKRT